ncbi:hypothetical protein [Pseudoalteromonas sp. NBT06-2]|uniref:hypothetical protein n=1 Tax=Pseudoalteromonas sp. NBT06-2 TaxID=2025950 RepID=UPI001481D95C|nr:hypothetical protein [Pseudoalteromonas sp. NBT06-2]
MTKKHTKINVIKLALRWFYRLLMVLLLLVAAYIGFEAFTTVYSNTHQVQQS